jgi:hypothetical protein
METALPCFGSDFCPFLTVPVTHNPSRKQFFAKLLGAAAAASVLPKSIAKSASAAAATVASSSSSNRAFEFRPDARAVARRESA